MDKFNRASAEERLSGLYLGKLVQFTPVQGTGVMGKIDRLTVENFTGSPTVIIFIDNKKYSVDYEYFEDSIEGL